MINRVFIYTPSKYPRGGANANYAQYLGAALSYAGYKTYIIAIPNVSDTTLKSQYGMELLPLTELNSKIFNRYFERIGCWAEIKEYLTKFHAGENDLFIMLGYNIYVAKGLLSFKNNNGLKLGIGILALFEEKDYVGSSHPRRSYRQTKLIYNELCPKFDIIFPISTYIEKHMKTARVKQLVLPIMADIEEYSHIKFNKTFDKWKFIIPASGKMKDNLKVMLECFVQLSDEELSNIEVHFCGIKKESILEFISYSSFERLKHTFVIHKWMDYQDLVRLYMQMHFLLLIRSTSQMTLANFPSKVPEVMCYGVVPIASKVGDYTDYYLENNINSIFVNGDTLDEALFSVRKALKLSQNEYMAMSKKARQCVESRFDYHVWAKPLQDAINSIGL